MMGTIPSMLWAFKLLGVLRLHSCFAWQSSYFAQDDQSLGSAMIDLKKKAATGMFRLPPCRQVRELSGD